MEIPTTDGGYHRGPELQTDFKIKLTPLASCAKGMVLLLYRAADASGLMTDLWNICWAFLRYY